MKFKYLLFVIIAIYSCNSETQENIYTSDLLISKTNTDSNKAKSISIIGVGDIMLGTNFPSDKHLPPAGTDLFTNVIEELQNADLRFGNLEGAIADSVGIAKKCSDPSICYAFRQPEYLVNQLHKANFNLLSIANNHIFDFGNDVVNNTVRVLDKYGFCFAGIEQKPWDTMSIKDLKIGFTAFAPNPGTLRITDYNLLKSIIVHLDSISDIVIVSFHGGAEGRKYRNIIRDYEEFYDENRGNVYEFAHLAIDYGADLVFGHGPHVTRAIELYKDRLIAYSLGNFCTYDRFNISGLNGIAPILNVTLSANGEFIDGEVISIKQKGRGIPQIDSTNAALKEIIELSNTDFPESKIKFEGKRFFKGE